MQPQLSIIVPIYNVEEYISDCIDSILSQTFRDFELILVNDGSPDRCGAICDRYAHRDSRIRVIHQENGGVSYARNKGIKIAKGDYIAFVDPDDTLEPTMYSDLMEYAQSKKVDITICQIRTINSITKSETISSVWNNYSVIQKEEIQNQIIPELLKGKTYSLVSSVNKIYKKSIFDSLRIMFDESKSHSEDARLNFTLLTQVDSLVYVVKPLYNYFIRKRESLTQQFRVDLYDYILDNKKFLIGICSQYGYTNENKILRNHFTNITLNHMQDVVINNDLKNYQKYNILQLIMNNKEFTDDLGSYICPSFFYRALKFLCKKKQLKLFYYIVTYKQKYKNFIQYRKELEHHV